MKQNMLIGGLSLAAALASATADAAARLYPHSGVQCIQADSSMTNIARSQYGVHNTSFTDGLTVECPVNISRPLSGPFTATNFGLQVYDRNPSADVSCDLQGIDVSGNVLYTSTITTSNSGVEVQPSRQHSERPSIRVVAASLLAASGRFCELLQPCCQLHGNHRRIELHRQPWRCCRVHVPNAATDIRYAISATFHKTIGRAHPPPPRPDDASHIPQEAPVETSP